ncbi:MAG: 4-hydroxybutyrate dehydrogenase [Clostridiales Family XIII bacterium]|jgi:4-hydroxybutyrate dehydrogenase|nr:4-hydroxybutyrate dehydrogenase [Clostridiales Family XIII bacterium]
MLALKIKPEIFYFDTVSEFNDEFKIAEDDFILTNEWIYKPYIEPLGVKPKVIFQEKYGTGEPTDEMINGIAAELKTLGNIRRIIAFGGGSTIDICKILALDFKDAFALFMGDETAKKNKELLIIPTTCGTGSEVTNVAVSGLKNGLKKGIATEDTFGDKAILIPETMTGLPYKVFSTSSVDALIHAVESYLSPKASPFTEIFSLNAIKLIVSGYKKILGKDQDEFKKYLKEFTLASNYGGIAFGNAGCAAVHALSYSIGGAFHVPHGEANYQFFTAVLMTYVNKKPEGKIKNLTKIISGILGVTEDNAYAEFDKFLGQIIEKKPLHEYGMTEVQIEEFAKSTIDNQQRLLVNNYIELSNDDLKEIFKTLY